MKGGNPSGDLPLPTRARAAPDRAGLAVIAARPTVLWDPAIPWHQGLLKEIEATAPALRLQPSSLPCGTEAMSEMRSRR